MKRVSEDTSPISSRKRFRYEFETFLNIIIEHTKIFTYATSRRMLKLLMLTSWCCYKAIFPLLVCLERFLIVGVEDAFEIKDERNKHTITNVPIEMISKCRIKMGSFVPFQRC
jgi:hypothetical protein